MLTVELLCSQSVKVLIRRTFPLQAKKTSTVSKNSNCKHRSSNCKQQSVQLQFRCGTVRGVPVFGADGSSNKKGFLCISMQLITKRGQFWFRFRLLKNASGSAFSSWEDGSGGSNYRFWFGSCTILSVICKVALFY